MNQCKGQERSTPLRRRFQINPVLVFANPGAQASQEPGEAQCGVEFTSVGFCESGQEDAELIVILDVFTGTQSLQDRSGVLPEGRPGPALPGSCQSAVTNGFRHKSAQERGVERHARVGPFSYLSPGLHDRG